LIDWCLTPTLAIFQLYHGTVDHWSLFKLSNINLQKVY